MHTQLWVILAVIIGVLLAVKEVRGWIIAVAVVLGMYFATTNGGQVIRHTIDSITHQPSSTSAPSKAQR